MSTDEDEEGWSSNRFENAYGFGAWVQRTSEPSTCGHESSGGGPCSECQPRKSWVEAGRMPREWKHVPWDALELKKHRQVDEESSDDIDDRHQQSIDDVLKRSVRLDNDSESSNELENWPRVQVSKFRRISDDDAPPPPVPVDSARSDEETPSPAQKPRPSKPTRTRPAPPRASPSSRKARSKSTAGRRPPSKASSRTSEKRGRSVDVGYNVRVPASKATRVHSSSRRFMGRNVSVNVSCRVDVGKSKRSRSSDGSRGEGGK